MRRHLFHTATLLSLLVPGLASAIDFDLVANPNQEDFRSAAEDVAATLNAKSLSPAEAGGITGFAIGVFGAYVPTDSPGAWKRLVGEKVHEIGLVGIVAQKGLPFGFDVGASYSEVPGSDARLFSAELRYAILEGGIAEPALGLRGSYSKMSGVDDIDYESYGTDISISKGIGPLTPYAGVGYVWSKFDPDDKFPLDKENVDKSRLFVGLRLSALFGITPEYERVGDRNSYNLRIGFAF